MFNHQTPEKKRMHLVAGSATLLNLLLAASCVTTTGDLPGTPGLADLPTVTLSASTAKYYAGEGAYSFVSNSQTTDENYQDTDLWYEPADSDSKQVDTFRVATSVGDVGHILDIGKCDHFPTTNFGDLAYSDQFDQLTNATSVTGFAEVKGDHCYLVYKVNFSRRVIAGFHVAVHAPGKGVDLDKITIYDRSTSHALAGPTATADSSISLMRTGSQTCYFSGNGAYSFLFQEQPSCTNTHGVIDKQVYSKTDIWLENTHFRGMTTVGDFAQLVDMGKIQCSQITPDSSYKLGASSRKELPELWLSYVAAYQTLSDKSLSSNTDVKTGHCYLLHKVTQNSRVLAMFYVSSQTGSAVNLSEIEVFERSGLTPLK